MLHCMKLRILDEPTQDDEWSKWVSLEGTSAELQVARTASTDIPDMFAYTMRRAEGFVLLYSITSRGCFLVVKEITKEY
ncbi:hypothetical protein B0I35DRAFT_492724 [Stachybotrys elegans]|uniref:Uncharacterized protein n=1 Tax=Stachybotrys elegans TaxID=80388 RepID=A0A8K0WKX6_9HYPO|nr:hypothetical protein B0I35DRAFT_492724 [Stachybotrys elegans]